MERNSWLIIGGALMLFALSLCLPALLFKNHEPLSGADVLALGWWGPLTGDFAWFANPAFIFGVYAFLKRKFAWSKNAAEVSLLLGAVSFFSKEWWFNEGHGTPIAGFGTGFYLWLMSFAVLYFGSWSILRHNSKFDTNASRRAT